MLFKKLLLKKENIYSIFVVILIFLLDRYSKIKILNNFESNSLYVNNFINFDLTWNTGIGFGLFSSDSKLFYNSTSILILCVVIILLLIAFKANKTEKIIFSIIIGGALGNFYDRVIFKAVPDFIDVHYASFHWFTFNVADIFITIGILTFILKDFLIKIFE
ncbi:signal peptidase II [Pelagibacteraceae bacterium]|nr:signal peptidase II [Pelagibacteraceae bacterium]